MLGRLGIAVGFLVAFVALSTVSPEAAAVAIVFGVIFVFPAFAYIDVMNIPQDVWESSGRSPTGWTIAFWFVPFLINVAATIGYWAWFRRRLPGGPLRAHDRVEISAGLRRGQVATLTSRRLLGAAGVWNAVVEDGVTIQVVSTFVRRASPDGGTAHGQERSAERVPGSRVPGSLKTRLVGLGCMVVVASTLIVAVGISMEDSIGTFVIVIGAIAAVFGLVQVAHTAVRFRSSRKLPSHLRSTLSPGQPVSLVLSDGRRVSSTSVVPGGSCSRAHGTLPSTLEMLSTYSRQPIKRSLPNGIDRRQARQQMGPTMPDPSASERRVLEGEAFGAPVPGRWPGGPSKLSDAQPATNQVLSRSWQAWVLSVCWAVGVAVGIAALVDGEWTAADAPLGIIAVLCIGLIVRTLRARVMLEADEVVLRGAFRTRRVPWRDIEHADVVPGARIPWLRNVQFTTKDGKRHLAEGVARFRPRRSGPDHPLEVFVGEVKSRIH